jgi:hypothetical protein
MNMLVAGFLLFALIIAGVYAAGWFQTPYLNAVRFAFYLLLILFILVVGFVIGGHQYEGYDQTVKVP